MIIKRSFRNHSLTQLSRQIAKLFKKQLLVLRETGSPSSHQARPHFVKRSIISDKHAVCRTRLHRDCVK